MGSLFAEIGALLLSWALGLVVTRPFFQLSSLAARFLWVSISWGFGAGLSSVIWFFLWLCPSFPPYVAALSETLLLILLWKVGGKLIEPVIVARRQPHLTLFTRIVLLVAAACFVLSLWYAGMAIWLIPDGEWDAWAIWNLHARIIAGPAHTWSSRLSMLAYSHPDYPLLQPLTIARLWMFGGNRSASAPIFTAFLFGFTPMLVVSSALAVFKSWAHAGIALIFLLGCNSFVHLGATEYADSGVSLYIGSTFVLLTAARLYNQHRLVFLAGLCAGFAAWTKNEGALFVAAVIVIALLLATQPKNRVPLKLLALPFAFGLVLPLLCRLVFRQIVNTRSDVLVWMFEWKRWAADFQWNRIWLIVRSFGNQIWKIEPWAIPPLLWLVIFLDTTRTVKARVLLLTVRRGLAVMGLMLLGYLIIYATSEQDLIWYLGTSLQRIILQLWPAFVFLVFLLARTPIPVAGEADDSAGQRRWS